MSLAWEVTDEDIAEALAETCKPNGEEEVKEVRTYLDLDRVEKAALYGDSIEKQAEYASVDIFEQIREQ